VPRAECGVVVRAAGTATVAQAQRSSAAGSAGSEMEMESAVLCAGRCVFKTIRNGAAVRQSAQCVVRKKCLNACVMVRHAANAAGNAAVAACACLAPVLRARGATGKRWCKW